MTEAPAGRPAAPPEPALEWSFNPWRERPGAAAVAVAAVGGGAALAGLLGTPALGCLALGGGFALSLAPLLFPVRCRVDEAGVARSGPLGWERRPWSALKRFAPVHGGILVSPFERPQPLDRFRALLLPIHRAERPRLREPLERRLDLHRLARSS